MCLDDLLLYSIKNDDLDLLADVTVCGADINEQDDHGLPPLSYALKLNKGSKMIERLIKLGAKVNLPDIQGVTPIMFGIQYNKSLEVINTLIKSGADVNAFDKIGMSCLMFVPLDKCSDDLCYSKEILSLLLSNGADILTVGLGGDSMLHKANCRCVLEILLHYRIPIEIRNFEGYTPLMTAMIQNNYDKVNNLLSLGADPNCKDVNLNTPLHIARDCEIVYNLMCNGADVNAVNKYGEKPLGSLLKGSGRTFYSVFSRQCSLFDNYVLGRNRILTPLEFFNRKKPQLVTEGSKCLDRDWKCHCNSPGYAVIKYALLTSAEWLFLNEVRGILMKFSNFQHFFFFVKTCRLEIKIMQETFVNDNVTFFQLCTSNELKYGKVFDIDESEFKFSRKQIKKLFPSFFDIIVMKLKYYKINFENSEVIKL